MITLTKYENAVFNKIVDRIIENAQHGISSYHVIKKFFEHIPEIVLEADYSSVAPKLKQMYTGAIKLASRELDQKILAVVGKEGTANRNAEAYSRIKKYILEQLYNLIVQTYDFKTPLSENTFQSYLKNRLLAEASLDMKNFKPNNDPRISKDLGGQQTQANNFKFIIQTIMRNMNNVFNNSIKTVKDENLKQKIQKINADIVKKSTDLFNNQLAPNVMPNFLDLTKSRVEKYEKGNKDDDERKIEQDAERDMQLVNRVLKFVGLPDVETISEKLVNEASVKQMHKVIVEKFRKAKLSKENSEFILKTLKSFLEVASKGKNAWPYAVGLLISGAICVGLMTTLVVSSFLYGKADMSFYSFFGNMLVSFGFSLATTFGLMGGAFMRVTNMMGIGKKHDQKTASAIIDAIKQDAAQIKQISTQIKSKTATQQNPKPNLMNQSPKVNQNQSQENKI
jgi:hypothetical protein